jgi:hypothetical protein
VANADTEGRGEEKRGQEKIRGVKARERREEK